MLKNILFFILLLSNVHLFAQNYIQYYNLVNEAEYWISQKEYENAIDLYLKAFEFEKPISKDAYLLAKSYALNKNSKEALYWLEESVKCPISKTTDLLINTKESLSFQIAFSEEGELEAIRQDLILLKEKEKQKDKGKRYKMLQDTVFTFFMRDAMNQPLRNAKNSTLAEQKMAHQKDSILQDNLLELIQTNGYPGFVNVGHSMLNAILIHIQEDVYDLYQKELFSELQKGNIYPKSYALFLETKHLEKEKSCYFFLENYTNDLCTPNDYKSIVERRLEIGMSIYFPGMRNSALEAYDLQPWVTDEFVAQHSLLDKD